MDEHRFMVYLLMVQIRFNKIGEFGISLGKGGAIVAR